MKTLNRKSGPNEFQTGTAPTHKRFDSLKQDIDALCLAMALPSPDIKESSTAELSERYQHLIDLFARHPASKKTWFQPGTDPKAAKALNTAYTQENLVRIFLGDPQTGRDWCEEFEAIGFVGRSSGVLKVPLLLEAYRASANTFESSAFGGAILCKNVLRIVDVLSSTDLYRHPLYQTPDLAVVGASEDMRKIGYFFSVVRHFGPHEDSQCVANFKDESQAIEHVAFLQGLRIGRPFRTRAQAAADILV